MYYYVIYKTNTKKKLTSRLKLKNGYTFNKRLTINLYNIGMIRYVLIKKLNMSLKGLINLYKFYEDDDDTRRDVLLPKIELLRNVFIEQYAAFLEETEIESYLDKFNKFEMKVSNSKSKKSRIR